MAVGASANDAAAFSRKHSSMVAEFEAQFLPQNCSAVAAAPPATVSDFEARFPLQKAPPGSELAELAEVAATLPLPPATLPLAHPTVVV